MAEPARPSRWRRPEIAAVVILGGVLLVAAVYRPGRMVPLSFCGFRAITGVPCPFCGMTRSFCAAASGDVGGAFRFHPVGPPLMAFTAVLFALALVDLLAGTHLLGALNRRLGRWPAWAWIALLALVWALRLAAFLWLHAPA